MSTRHRRKHGPVTTALVRLEDAVAASLRPDAACVAQSDATCAPSHELIAARAGAIWGERGCPKGQDLDIWLAAESELRGLAN